MGLTVAKKDWVDDCVYRLKCKIRFSVAWARFAVAEVLRRKVASRYERVRVLRCQILPPTFFELSDSRGGKPEDEREMKEGIGVERRCNILGVRRRGYRKGHGQALSLVEQHVERIR